MLKNLEIEFFDDRFINFYINLFSIFSACFIFLQFERYEGNSEKWDILLFLLLLTFALISFLSLLGGKEYLMKRNIPLSILGFYSLYKGISVIEYETWPGLETAAGNVFWFGFGIEVFILSIIIFPFILKILFSTQTYFNILRILIFLYLILSYLLSHFQFTDNLIDIVHSSYVFDEILSIKSGKIPYQDFIPQYQTLFTYTSLLLPNLEVLPLLNIYLLSFFSISVFILVVSIKLISNSYRNFNLINSTIIFVPFLVVAPIFYSRLEYGGTIAALITAYPVRIFPFFVIFLIFFKGYNFSDENHAKIINDKFLYIAFYLLGLNLLNNFEFGLAALFTCVSVLLITEMISKHNLMHLIKKIILLLSVSVLGSLTLIGIYKLYNLNFEINYIGWWFKQYATSNALGKKIVIPGPSQFILPIVLSTLLGHIYFFKSSLTSSKENLVLMKNSIFGMGFCIFTILGLPYYIGRSYASGQLQIFLLPVSLSFALMIGSLLTHSKITKINVRSINQNFFNSIFFILLISVFISSSIISSTPNREMQRIINGRDMASWPSQLQLEIINEVSDFKKSLSDEKIGYFGDFSNIISYQTGLFSVTNVSGIDNVKMNSVFSFQTLLYNQSCETIEENKFDYIVTDKNATKINNLVEFQLCNNYVIQEAYNYSEIFILKKK